VTSRLLRFSRRRASWEEDDPEKVAQIEFRNRDGALDLRPSVYEAWPEEGREGVVRTFAEHGATFLRDPPRSREIIDVRSAHSSPEEATPGATLFSYANARHREIPLGSTRDLHAFVATLLSQLHQRSLQPVTPDEMLGHMSTRLAAADPEWEAALAPEGAADRWMKHIARYRKRSGVDVPDSPSG
jgi:hypothetical protein